MAKKSRFTDKKPGKKKLSQEKEKEMEQFIQSSVEKMPHAKKKKETLARKSTSKLVSRQGSRQEDMMRKVGLNLPESTIRILRAKTFELKDLYGTDGPDRNHIVDLAVRRLCEELNGKKQEQLVKELLDLRQLSKERQKPK